MKQFLPCLLALFSYSFLSGQSDCTPDNAYADSTGVFPMPYDPVVNPSGGINECAVVGQPYEFVFTVGVGDSITVVLNGTEFRLPLDKVKVTDVLGLPSGINYDCSENGCEFLKNTVGCAELYGTTNAAPGDYQLEIKATVYFPSFPFQYNATFPDPDIAPGEYKLQVLADQSQSCTAVGTKDVLAKKMKIEANPNPSSGPVAFNISSKITGDFNFKVLNLFGKTMQQGKVTIFEGNNNLAFDGSHLPNGLYLAYFENGQGVIAQKFTIQH